MAPSDEGPPEPAPGVLGEPSAQGKVSAEREALCFDEKSLLSPSYFLCKVKLQGKIYFRDTPSDLGSRKETPSTTQSR